MKPNKKEIINLCIFTVIILAGLIGILLFCMPKTIPAGNTTPPPSSSAPEETPKADPSPSPSPVPLPTGFVYVTDVVPDVIVKLKYYGTDNFVGRQIPGYEANKAILTEEAANALAKAAAIAAKSGYRLVIYDAYRPADAVAYFVAWGQDSQDLLMKEQYYPNLTKEQLFGMYIASKSNHSKGSTVDITLADATGTELDMGSPLDVFDEKANTYSQNVPQSAFQNRILLRDIMQEAGFSGSSTEWWHFRLENEPYPDTYFNFYIR